MDKHNCKEGFTLIELSISLVFISILSIAVVLVIIGAISSYHRGITLNKVDSVGAGLVEDIRRSIQASAAGSLTKDCSKKYDENTVVSECEDDGGRNFASVVQYAEVEVGNESIGTTPVFGALCTGSYSYIWNSGYFFDKSEYNVVNAEGVSVEGASLRYKMSDEGSERTMDGFKLLKVEDGTRAVCEAAVKGARSDGKENYSIGSNGIGSEFDMAAITSTNEEPMEYLNGSEENDSNLAVYSLTTTVTEQVDVYKNIYYYNSLILGTVRGGINISVSGNNCATPEGENSELGSFDYCAINKFNFAALAKGGQ